MHNMLARRLPGDLKVLSPQQLSNSLISIVQLKISHQQVCVQFAAEIMRRDLKTFPFAHLVSVAKSLATLNCLSEQISFSIAREAVHRFGKIPPPTPALIDLMWAFAAADALKNPAVNSFFHLRYPAQTHPPSNAAAAARQLLEIQLALGQKSSATAEAPLLASLLAPQGWVQAQLAETQAKRQVSEPCKRAGEMLQETYPTIEVGGTVLNGLPTDLVIKSRRAVVQFYDSADFLQNEKLTGDVLFIQRLLLRANFHVYRLSKHYFSVCTPDAQRAQIQHLVRLIEQDAQP